jgi:hypothetical protein
MKGPRKDIDMTFLQGKELHHICIGLHVIQLHFNENVGISIQKRVTHLRKGKVSVWERDKPPLFARGLLTLLGSSIIKVSSKTALILKFSNKDTVTIYEAYDVWHNNQLFAVRYRVIRGEKIEAKNYQL